MTVPIDKELKDLFALFSDKEPTDAELIDTGRSETDFRNAVIFTTADNDRLVIKLSDNDFTSPERIKIWRRTVKEYKALGYYSPEILCSRQGDFPYVNFKGHRCIAYAEEYVKYHILEQRDDSAESIAESEEVTREKWIMTAKVAAKHFDYAPFPSAYCLFDRFCPSDKTDEVTEQAQDWKKKADKLPEQFREQVERIWKLWQQNREKLEKVYHTLPSSVFQADLNTTNLLIDDDGHFAGVFDYNLCGKEVFLNYIFRENFARDFETEIEKIKKVLKITAGHYEYSKEEKQYALMLYRCLKPIRKDFEIEELLNSGADNDKISACLDSSEHYLTAEIELFDLL
ncbi:MAG: phosphotransferase [Ruminococcus sp.]|nr:phosphotransferase [Ruminococcus sp.]